MTLITLEELIQTRGVDIWSPSGNYQRHHALLTHKHVQGLPPQEQAKIDDPRNLLIIPAEHNISHAQIPTRELAVAILSKHYGFNAIREWFDSVVWKNSPPFQLDPPEDTNAHED